MGVLARLSKGIRGTSKKEQEAIGLKWVAVAAAATMIVVNALANILPINGQDTGAISDKYANLFAPAGLTFAIWGVIYALVIGYCVYQFMRVRGKQSLVSEATLARINRYFILSSVLNGIWIFTWHYEILWLSVIVIVGILYYLIRINLLLNHTPRSKWDAVWIRSTFGIYLGWLTVATVADVTAWLVSTGWGGFGLSAGTWTVALLLIAAAIALVAMIRLRSWQYGAVIVWAYAGILFKHLDDKGWNGQYPSVLATLYILLPVLIVSVMVLAILPKQSAR